MIIAAWRRSPLRRRLRLSLAAVLLVSVAVADLVLLGAARHAIDREVAASMAAANRHVALVLDLLPTVSAAEQTHVLRVLQASYVQARHVCLQVTGVGLDGQGCGARSAQTSIPDWFLSRITQARAAHRYQLDVAGQMLTLTLMPVIEDEAAEVWEETRASMLAMILMAMLLHAVLAWLIGRSLMPIEQVAAALDRLRAGQPQAHAAVLPDVTAAPPEFRSLSEGIRAFEQRLHDDVKTAQLVHRAALDGQEQERRRLARELHDELGQQLTAIELEAAALQSAAAADQAPGLSRIVASVRETHRISRRVLRRLRPEAFETLGLAGSLEGLLDGWQQRVPEWTLTRRIDPAVDHLVEDRAIHVFRVAQEALSNVARHAQARRVVFEIQHHRHELALTVDDDGIGPTVPDPACGLGLLGIAERVEALGGRWDLAAREGGGSRLFVALPHSED